MFKNPSEKKKKNGVKAPEVAEEKRYSLDDKAKQSNKRGKSNWRMALGLMAERVKLREKTGRSPEEVS